MTINKFKFMVLILLLYGYWAISTMKTKVESPYIIGMVSDRTVVVEENFTQYTTVFFENGISIDLVDVVLDLGDKYKINNNKLDISSILKSENKEMLEIALKDEDTTFSKIKYKPTELVTGLNYNTNKTNLDCNLELYRETREDEYYLCELNEATINNKNYIVESCKDIVGYLKKTNPKQIFNIPKEDWYTIDARLAKAGTIWLAINRTCKNTYEVVVGEDYTKLEKEYNKDFDYFKNDFSFNLYYTAK